MIYRPDPDSKQHQTRLAVQSHLEELIPSRETLESLAIKCAQEPSPDNTFEYAFCLAKSASKDERRYSITILDNLVKEGYEHQIDCMYGSAVAYFLNKRPDKARINCEAILRAQPEHKLATDLHLACLDAIQEQEAKSVEKIVIGSSAAIAGVGLALGVAGMLLGG